MTVSGSGPKSVRSSPRSQQRHEVLADVVHALADHAQVGVAVEAEDLARLALEHQRAARRRADDVDARARRRREPCAPSAARSLRREVEHAVGLRRQPAALLAARDLDLAAEVLEQLDRHLARVAARTSWRRSRGSRRRGGRRAARRACGPSAGTSAPDTPAARRGGRVPISRSPSERSGALRSVQFADRRGRRRQSRPITSGRASRRSRSLKPVRSRIAGARLRVDLGDVHALRAHLRADAAARAVVERGVRPTPRRGRGSARPAARRTSGPGNSGVTLETGQNVSQIVHLTQWSSEPAHEVAQHVVLDRHRQASAVAGCDRSRRAEDQLGRPEPGRQADAVARLLPPRLGAGQRRPGDEHVLEPLRPQLAIDGHARRPHRVIGEVVRQEPLVRGHAAHRQAERHLPCAPARVELEAAGGEAAGRQHEPVAAVVDVAQPDPGAHRGHAGRPSARPRARPR